MRARDLGAVLLALSMTALMLVGAPSTRGATSTFSNDGFINIKFAASGPVNPYPSEIEVSGVKNPTSVTATFHNFGHTTPHSVASLLVAPNGNHVLLHSDVGGNDAFGTDDTVEDLTITFDDAGGPLSVEGPLTSGTFRPTRHPDPEERPNSFDPPAPQPPGNDTRNYGTTMAGLLDGGINGTWKLFVDNYANSQGDIEGGWSLSFASGGSEGCPIAGSTTVAARGLNKTCDWQVSFTFHHSGLPESAEDSWINTTIAGRGLMRFDKLPRPGKKAEDNLGDFDMSYALTYRKTDGSEGVYLATFEGDIGKKVQIRLGADRIVQRLPIWTNETSTDSDCEGDEGRITLVQGETIDAFTTKKFECNFNFTWVIGVSVVIGEPTPVDQAA